MPNKAICYAKSAIAFLELCESLKLHDRLYLAIQNEEEEIFYIDFSKYLAEQPVFKNEVSDWDELEVMLISDSGLAISYQTQLLIPQQQLFTKLVDGETRTYSELTPFLSDVDHQLAVYSVDNNIGVDVSYSLRNSPFTRNLKTIKWKLKDLIFTHTTSTHVVNFANTIPIVNGLACYPKYWNDELFAYEGSNLLRNNPNTTKGLVLLDFSNIGDIETHLLSSCVNFSNLDTNSHSKTMVVEEEPKVKFTGTINVYNTDEFVIEVQLPDTASSGIPIICIAGRLFFPYEDDLYIKKVNGKSVVKFVINRITLEKILSTNLQKFGKQIPNTGNINIDVNDFLDYLFVDHLGDFYKDPVNEHTNVRKYFADTCIPYIVILKSDKKLMFKKSNPIGTILPDKLRFEPNAGGLLVNANTREIIDYVRIQYDSCTLVTFAPEKPLEFIERDSPHLLSGNASAGSQLNYQRKDAWNAFSHSSNLRDLNAYYLLDIAKV